MKVLCRHEWTAPWKDYGRFQLRRQCVRCGVEQVVGFVALDMARAAQSWMHAHARKPIRMPWRLAR